MILKTIKIHRNIQVPIAILCHCFVRAQTILVTLLCQGTSCLGHTVVNARNVLVDIYNRYFTIHLKFVRMTALTVGRCSVQSRYSECRRDYMTKILT
jgi:hypothetical protein